MCDSCEAGYHYAEGYTAGEEDQRRLGGTDLSVYCIYSLGGKFIFQVRLLLSCVDSGVAFGVVFWDWVRLREL